MGISRPTGDASKGLDAGADQAHWGIPDPAAVEGAEEVRLAAFCEVWDAIGARIDAFLTERSGR